MLGSGLPQNLEDLKAPWSESVMFFSGIDGGKGGMFIMYSSNM